MVWVRMFCMALDCIAFSVSHSAFLWCHSRPKEMNENHSSYEYINKSCVSIKWSFIQFNYSCQGQGYVFNPPWILAYMFVFVCDASSSVKSDLRKSTKCFLCHFTDISSVQLFPFVSCIYLFYFFFLIATFLFWSVIFYFMFSSVLMLRLGLGTGIFSQNMIFSEL